MLEKRHIVTLFLRPVIEKLRGLRPMHAGTLWELLKHISPWEQKIYTRLVFERDYETELIPVQEMLAYFEQWGKWKGLAIHYVWEDGWWRRRNEHIPWLEQLIRL
jgi:hypothetical protein